jgi:hypothetical protein
MLLSICFNILHTSSFSLFKYFKKIKCLRITRQILLKGFFSIIITLLLLLRIVSSLLCANRFFLRIKRYAVTV